MENGLVFLARTPNSQERGLVGSQRVLSLLDSMTMELGSHESWLHHAWQAGV